MVPARENLILKSKIAFEKFSAQPWGWSCIEISIQNDPRDQKTHPTRFFNGFGAPPVWFGPRPTPDLAQLGPGPGPTFSYFATESKNVGPSAKFWVSIFYNPF